MISGQILDGKNVLEASNLLQQDDIGSGRNGRIYYATGDMSIAADYLFEYDWIAIQSQNVNQSVHIHNSFVYRVGVFVLMYVRTISSTGNDYKMSNDMLYFVALDSGDDITISGSTSSRAMALFKVYRNM